MEREAAQPAGHAAEQRGAEQQPPARQQQQRAAAEDVPKEWMREARELRLSQQLAFLPTMLRRSGAAGASPSGGPSAAGGGGSLPPPARRDGVEAVRMGLTAPEARVVLRRRRRNLPGHQGARWRLAYDAHDLGRGLGALLLLAAQCHILGRLRAHRRRGALALSALPLLPVPDALRTTACPVIEFFAPPMLLLTLSVPLRAAVKEIAPRIASERLQQAAADYVETRAGYVTATVAKRRAETERAAEEAFAAVGVELPRFREVEARLEQMRGSMTADAEEFHRSVVEAAQRTREQVKDTATSLAERARAFFNGEGASSSGGGGGGGGGEAEGGDVEGGGGAEGGGSGGAEGEQAPLEDALSGPPTPGSAPALQHSRTPSFNATRGLLELLDGYNSGDGGLHAGQTQVSLLPGRKDSVAVGGGRSVAAALGTVAVAAGGADEQLEEETIDELEDASDEPRHALSPLPSSRGNGNGNSATSSNGAATPSPPRAARAFSVGL